MEGWKLCFAVLFLLCPNSRAQDTVSQDIGAHQIERLVMLLTMKECEDLVEALSTSEENIFTRLERLAPENNQLLPLSKRGVPTTEEREAECKKALTDWLLKYGEDIYYDRLTRALQHIGRTDVALEVGKNINQDKLLNLKLNVEDYHRLVSSFQVPEEPSGTKSKLKSRNLKGGDLSSRDMDLIIVRRPVVQFKIGLLDVIVPMIFDIVLGYKGGDLSWRDLELIVVRSPVAQYRIGPLDVVVPMICGFALGFGGMFLLGLWISWLSLYISVAF